ncbi:MAG: tryptophan-rich sensory protein [Spirochaetota bacterium]
MSDPQRSQSDVIRQLVVLVLLVAGTVAANILGLAMGETDTGNIANDTFTDTVFFFPGTYVFVTIWPVIYLGILGLAVHQALPSQATNPRYRRGMWMLAINLLLNAGWVAVFGAELFILSLVTIVPILATAVLAYAWLDIGRSSEASTAEKVLLIAVSIYTAWLTIATVANVSLALVSGGWNGFGISYETWGTIMIVVGIGLGVVLMLLFSDPAFPAVYAYAYAGIVVRRLGETPAIAFSAGAGAAIFIVLFVVMLAMKRKRV